MKNKLDSKRSRLYNMYQDFRIQFMANNGRFAPEYWKGTKSQLQTENIDNKTVEIETTNPTETQDAEVQGQGKILKEKKRTAKCY